MKKIPTTVRMAAPGWITATTLCLALALTLAMGTGAARAQEIDEERRAEMEARLQETAERLELSEDQRAALEPILRKSMEERRTIMESYGLGEGERPNPRTLRGMRTEMQKLQEQTKSEVSGILSDEQMTEYLAIQEERREQMRAEIRSRMNR